MSGLFIRLYLDEDVDVLVADDPLAFGAATAVLLALAANCVPAARTDPVEVLKEG